MFTAIRLFSPILQLKQMCWNMFYVSFRKIKRHVNNRELYHQNSKHNTAIVSVLAKID